MKATTETETQSRVRCEDLLCFLREKLADAEKALVFREESEAVWRDGDADTWRSVGCKLTFEQRLMESKRHGRIAAKCRREIELFKAAIGEIEKHNTKMSGT